MFGTGHMNQAVAMVVFPVMLASLTSGCDSSPSMLPIKVKIKKTPVMSDRNPLLRELDRTTPDEFERLVEARPELVNYVSRQVPDQSPLLAATAIVNKPQHALVLLRHRADVELAVQWCKRNGNEEWARWIQQRRSAAVYRGQQRREPD